MLELLDFLDEVGKLPVKVIEGDNPSGTLRVGDVVSLGNEPQGIRSRLDYLPEKNGDYEFPATLRVNEKDLNIASSSVATGKRHILHSLREYVTNEDFDRLFSAAFDDSPSGMLAAAVRERDYMIKAAEGKQLVECGIIKENMKEILEFIRGLGDFVVPRGNWRLDELLLENICVVDVHGGARLGWRDVEELLEEYPVHMTKMVYGDIYWIPSYFAFRNMNLGELWFSKNKDQGPDPLVAVRDLSEIKKRIIDWAVSEGAILSPETVKV
jgi:hypothetical protein